MSVKFEVLDGPNKGNVYEFRGRDSFVLGRAEDCHCALPDDPYVSRHHFVLETNPPACVIKDLGGRNGVTVNDVRYGKKAEKPTDQPIDLFLKHGDCIKVGHTTIRVVVLEDATCEFCHGTFSPTAQAEGVWKEGRFLCSGCAVDHPAVAGRSSAKPEGLIDPDLDGPASGLPEIPGYRLLRQIGRGFYTSVFLARDLTNGAPVALRLRPVDDSETVDMRLIGLRRDFEICSRLKHLNIVRWEQGPQSGRLAHYRLPYWPVGNVGDLLKGAGGRIGVEEAVSLVTQALDGLEHAHGHTVVHRDVRPANILLVRHEFGLAARLTGFGFALDPAFPAGGDLGSRPNSRTFPYLPPEQLRSFMETTAAADVFGAGATLYRMITGGSAYPLDGAADPLKVILAGKTVPIRERDPSVSAGLAEAIDRALNTDPGGRHRTAGEFRTALLRAVSA